MLPGLRTLSTFLTIFAPIVSPTFMVEIVFYRTPERALTYNPTFSHRWMAMASYINLTAFSDRGFTTHSNGIGSLRVQRSVNINSVSFLTLWTHRRRPLSNLASGILGRPSSSTGGRMSNVVRMRAIVRYSNRSAKCRPGQTLSQEIFNQLVNVS